MQPKACKSSSCFGSRLAFLLAGALAAAGPFAACNGGSSSSSRDDDKDDETPGNGGAGGSRAGAGGGAGSGMAGGGGAGGGGGTSTGGAGGGAGAPQGGSGGGMVDAGASGDGGTSGNADQTACRAMLEAANAFVTSLGNDAAKKAAALLPFADRKHFKYTPGDRPGLPLRQMTADQRTKALALVRAVTSNAGYTKAEGIRQLELVLRAQEGNQARDPDGYFVAVHGTPSLTADWAVRWEGHHLSLSFTFSGCAAYASAPAFMGTNPATVTTSVQGAPAMGTRVLGREEDLARELATLLDADAAKKAVAIRAGIARDVQDSPAKVSAPMPAGLPASKMNAAETTKLRAIVDEYAGTMAPILAKARLAKIEAAGWDKVTFLWSGSLQPGQAHYYRIVGTTFMIEYQNAQNNANHVHAVWRDFDGDFGDDILGKHLQAVRH